MLDDALGAAAMTILKGWTTLENCKKYLERQESQCV